MQKENDAGSRPETERSQTERRDVDGPLPDVPFMRIAAFLGLLVLVLLGAAAYSISQTFDGVAFDGTLLAAAVFLLATAIAFWAIDRYQPRRHES